MLRSKLITSIAVALFTVITAVQAQDLQIVARPLSGQEVEDHGLTNTTQTCGGLLTVGVGMPAYLEVQLEQDTVFTQVVWSLDSRPGTSVAALEASPIADTNVFLIYDGGEREDYNVAGRQLYLAPAEPLVTERPTLNHRKYKRKHHARKKRKR